ncbi:hypothetical protein Bca4012_010573 [Brassica carinata]
MYAKANVETMNASRKLEELEFEELKLKEHATKGLKEKETQKFEQRRREKRETKEKEKLKESSLVAPKLQYQQFTSEEIKTATSSFSEDLNIGKGAYGDVYKCNLRHTIAAVKVLHSPESNLSNQFDQEVCRALTHPHLVLLLGACRDHGALVYEYMENGSLEDRLFQVNKSQPIPWFVRFRIAWEVASALIFLHQSKPTPVIHRDLKPANILLDQNFVSKVGDVGISTMIQVDPLLTQVTMYKQTSPVGTLCYIDPEYQRSGMLSFKSDVYAFGMIILQLLTALPAIALTYKVEAAMENNELIKILDKKAGDWPMEETCKLAALALSCTEMRAKDRPDLETQILPALESFKNVAEEARNLISSAPKQPPSHFLCPLLKDVMSEPCVAADGYTYDRRAIEEWMEDQHTSPVTNLPLQNTNLLPNHSVYAAIGEWRGLPNSLPGPRIEAPSTTIFLDAGEASVRRRRDLCFDTCSPPLTARSTVFSFNVSLLGGPHDDESLMRLSLSVRRGASYFCFGVLTTESVTFWRVPHRCAVSISFNPRAPHPFCSCSPDLLTGKASKPEVVSSHSSRSISLRPVIPPSLPPPPLLVLSRRSLSQPLSSFINLGALQPCVSGAPLLTMASDLYRELLKTSSPPSAITISTMLKTYIDDPSWKSDAFLIPLLRLAGSIDISGELDFAPSDASLLLTVVERSISGELYIEYILISRLVCSVPRVLPSWAWPVKKFEISIIIKSPPIHKLVIDYLSAGLPMVLRISGGFTGIPFVRIVLFSACVKVLQVGSPGSVLFRSSSSLEEKISSPYPFSIERDVSSDSLPSVCFSIFISLYSCVAVSTGPEDAIEIASVVFVDEIWTSTSLFVTIFLLSDVVVKAPPTHSSIVLNPLSSSLEDLSCLTYLSKFEFE